MYNAHFSYLCITQIFSNLLEIYMIICYNINIDNQPSSIQDVEIKQHTLKEVVKMKYCLKCGNQITDDSVFCVHCGGEQQNTGNPPQQPSSSNIDSPQMTDKEKMIFLVGVIAFIIGAYLQIHKHGFLDFIASAIGFFLAALIFIGIIIAVIHSIYTRVMLGMNEDEDKANWHAFLEKHSGKYTLATVILWLIMLICI